ncbi:hypothetical protein [Hymenobacter sp. DG01]|uniref:hypothetical protein n=1 Tax=Hymenobacter sp. DG01 TaxID=2584940 RepID=UPI00112201EC|nr:hypothetical protein [Hymenobacter sp. DG01]
MLNNFLIFFTLSQFYAPSSCEEDVRKALAVVINSPEVTAFLSNYTGNKKFIYIKQSNQPICNGKSTSLARLKHPYKDGSIIIYSHEPLAKGEKLQASKQDYFTLPKNKVVIIIDYLSVTSPHAEIKLRIPIEGVHGSFTLTKNPTWSVTKSDVYER